MKKADQRLAKKKAELDKDSKEKLKVCREQASREYASKFKKHEERFKRRYDDDGHRIRQLEQLNDLLRSAAKRAKESRSRAVEARERAMEDLNALTTDMEELSAQVGPMGSLLRRPSVMKKLRRSCRRSGTACSRPWWGR